MVLTNTIYPLEQVDRLNIFSVLVFDALKLSRFQNFHDLVVFMPALSTSIPMSYCSATRVGSDLLCCLITNSSDR